MFLNAWRRWFGAARSSPQGRRRPRVRLFCENLEERSVPAITLTGLAISPTEGAAFHGTVAILTDPTPAGLAATINWGDGTTSPADGNAVQVSPDANVAGRFDVVGTHTYTQAGNVNLVVAVSDSAGNAATTAPYTQTDLVTDNQTVLTGLGFAPAAHVDTNLLNPWGISFAPGGPFWISDNNSGLSTLYDGAGNGQGIFTVAASTNPGATSPSPPTGTVYNGTSDFVVSSAAGSGPALFIFATEDGTIAAWSPAANASTALIEVDDANFTTGPVYKGLAIGNNGTGNFLYAANFRAGTIDVFNKNFQKVSLAGSFTDPNIPAGFAPFNIQNINNLLYVTYAKQDASKHDDVAGAGNGFVDEFDMNGNLVKRVASQGTLNSPWGLALAPSTFGAFAGDLLVGNFGDGHISVFNPNSGTFLGQLTNGNNQPLAIDHLWALSFGNTGPGANPNTLYFTAGINNEQDGLFGSLTASTDSSTAVVTAGLTLTSISPTTVTPGSAATTITLTGASFVAASTADFNGTALATTFISATQLTAVVPAADLTTAETAAITVVNPGGVTSAPQTFTIGFPTFMVTDTLDDLNPGSLRREILDANATSGPVMIDFKIATSGVQTIQPASALPAITNPAGVTLDGTSEPGFSTTTNTPLIVLDGISAGIADGLVFTGGHATIKGLAIQNFAPSAAGLVLASSNNTVQGNFIGTDATGTVAAGNFYGIYLPAGASNNTIGGTTAAARNVISGNTIFGVLLESSGTSGNVVEGNFIGTNAAGTAPLPNTLFGVGIAGAAGNTIGGTTAAAANVLSGNGVAGVLLDGSGTSGNVIQGNRIGTNSNSATGLGNTDFGVLLISGADGNTIGGPTAAAGNVIGSNGQFGVVLNAATGNLLEANAIGAAATTALPNGLDGVVLDNGAANNTLGGTATGAGNVISGNDRFGVFLTGSGTSGNVLEGNLLGTDAAGTTAVPNGDDGVALFNGAAGNTVGGTAAGAGNVLSGNARFGVYLNGSGTSGNVVQGNRIGTSSTGTLGLGNGDDGVALLSGASGNTIGGTTAAARNVISANNRFGVLLGVSGTANNLVQGNFIGTDASGTVALGNNNDGVAIMTGAANNTLGGTAPGAGNTIAGNGVAGSTILGNGVLLANSGTSGNVVQGNFIGTDRTGTLSLGNKGSGVAVINSAANNLIGVTGNAAATGAAPAGGNIVANNGGGGVIVGINAADTAATGNAILGNTIDGNGGASGLGIDLGDQGKPATQGAGAGPNDFQPAPAITTAVLGTGGIVTINFSLTARAGTYRLEFFLNNSTDVGPEGRFFLGSQNVTVTSSGTAVTGSFVFTPSAGTGNLVPAHGQVTTATATLLGGAGNTTPSDTSEFSSPGGAI